MKSGPKKKEFDYVRYGEIRTSGTFDELIELTGHSLSKLRILRTIGLKRDYEEYPEYLLEMEPYLAEYAFYAGEEIISVGTIEEISEDTGLKVRTVEWYGTPSGQARGNRALVKMDDDEEDYA